MLLAVVMGAAVPLAPVSGGNALTLPAQRHVVRLTPTPGTTVHLAAIQQGGADGRGLGFFRSDDDGESFSYYAPIQDDWRHEDRVDLLAAGNDIALVYSYEGPRLSGSTAHDVTFQWWRYEPATDDWRPGPRVTVFDSSSASTAYSRAELVLDGRGRIWVQAFRLEPDGSSTAVVAVSSDDGSTFASQPSLASLPLRGGGRLLSLGSRLFFLYDMHDGLGPAYFRTREDGDALATWGPEREAFPEGIYHGAALSAVADGRGGAHVVYKDEGERLSYRRFDGQSFGSRTILEATGDWALQPAVTRVGDGLAIFYNRPISATNYELRARTLRDGRFSEPVVLDAAPRWKGYLASPEILHGDTEQVVCLFGATPDASQAGDVAAVILPWARGGGVPDAGAPPDAGSGGTPDAGSSAPAVFEDRFERAGNGLGPAWSATGLWYTKSRAISDLDAQNLAAAAVRCRDCRAEASVIGFGVPDTAIFVRASDGMADRYELSLRGTGRLELRRIRAQVTTVLAEGPSGVSALGSPARLGLSAVGTQPVRLIATVNGVTRLTATDASSDALRSAGSAGLSTTRAGVVFDDFVVSGDAGGAGTPDAGTPDAGTPDAGTPDAGTPDAGTPDAGTPDAGTPDAGTPDAGTPDAGTPDAGAPDAAPFVDDFNRSARSGLGSAWIIRTGLWLTDGRAISDLDGDNLAEVSGRTSANVTVAASVIGFGVPDVSLVARSAGSDRYLLTLLGNGRIRIRRIRAGVSTSLGEVASGISSLSERARLSLTVQGTAPVRLIARVDGALKLEVTDSSSGALTQTGGAGISTSRAGVVFDDFWFGPP